MKAGLTMVYGCPVPPDPDDNKNKEEPKKEFPPKKMEIPFLCPVCNGSGWKFKTFYEPNYKDVRSSIIQVDCRTCKGAGIIWGTSNDK